LGQFEFVGLHLGTCLFCFGCGFQAVEFGQHIVEFFAKVVNPKFCNFSITRGKTRKTKRFRHDLLRSYEVLPKKNRVFPTGKSTTDRGFFAMPRCQSSPPMPADRSAALYEKSGSSAH